MITGNHLERPIPTVKVKNFFKKNKGGHKFLVINKTAFDPEIHELYDAEKVETKKPAKKTAAKKKAETEAPEAPPE